MNYNPKQHDAGVITTTFTTPGIGLKIARDKNNLYMWQEFDDPILASQYFTGTPDASYRPPDKEIVISQHDFRAGYGLKYFSQSEPERYYHSKNCDGRFRGQMISGPLATAITKPTTPSAPTITDGDMELWDSSNTLTNWDYTLDSGTSELFQDDANERQGTYSARIGNNGSSGTGHLDQTVDSTDDYAGLTLTYTQYCKSSVASAYRIAIYDGVGRTYSSYHAGGGGYENLSVAHTCNVAATEVTIEIYKSLSSVGFGYFDGAATLAVTAITVGVQTAHAEFNDELYQSFGKILTKLNGTGTTFDYVATMPATITDMAVINWSGTDYLYLGQGDSNDLVYMNTSEVFVSSPSNERAYFFIATPSNLYGIKQAGGNKLRKATNVDTWGDVTLVGNGFDDHTDLLIDGANTIIVPKDNFPYYIDGSNNDQPYIPEMLADKSSTSGKNSFLWQGNIHIQAGDQTLYKYAGTAGAATSVITDISPAKFMSDLSDFSGKIQAITGDGTYLYIVLDNSTKIEILAGRQETVGGSTDQRWHPIAQLTLTGCETAYISSVYKKRLWICSTNASNDMYYYPVTTKYGDIANDSDYKYQGDGEFWTPWHHVELRGDNKAYYNLTLTLGHSFDTNIYFEAHYQKWGDSSWTDIGDFKGTSSDRTPTSTIPVDGSSNEPVSTFIRFKFVPKTDDTSKSPILEDYDCRGVWRPTKRFIIACTVEADTDYVLKDGTMDKGAVADIVTAMDEAYAATWPITFNDIYETALTVNFIQPSRSYPVEIEESSDQRRVIKRRYDLLLQKVSVHS